MIKMMLRLTVLILCLFSASAQAREFYLLEPTDVSFTAHKNDSLHDPYLAPDDQNLVYGAAFQTNFYIVKYGDYALRWDNNLHFDQDDQTGQVRAAGWQYGVYLTVWADPDTHCPKVEVGKEHHSQHILDRERDEHFPVYDRWVLVANLYHRGTCN